MKIYYALQCNTDNYRIKYGYFINKSMHQLILCVVHQAVQVCNHNELGK